VFDINIKLVSESASLASAAFATNDLVNRRI